VSTFLVTFFKLFYLDLHGQDSEWHKDPPLLTSYARYSCPSNFTTLILDRLSIFKRPVDSRSGDLQLTNATATPNANANFFIYLSFTSARANIAADPGTMLRDMFTLLVRRRLLLQLLRHYPERFQFQKSLAHLRQ